MLIPEAVELVLHAAITPSAGGTFIFEMGEQVPIVELARNLIRVAGLRPGVDIQIVFHWPAPSREDGRGVADGRRSSRADRLQRHLAGAKPCWHAP